MGQSARRSSAVAAFVVFVVLCCASDVRGAGCPANSSADSLRMVAEYLLHRPASTFGDLFFDEVRSVLLFTVNSEIWRIPIDPFSTQVFVCNSSAQSYENALAYAVDQTNGVIHLGATEGLYTPVIISIDYNGIALQMKNKVAISWAGQWAGSPQCVLYVNSTQKIVTVFRQSGAVILNGTNPFQASQLFYVDHSKFGYANVTSCILDERSNKVYMIGQNYSTTVLITMELGSYVVTYSAFRPETSGTMKTIGVLAPDNNRLYLANSNFSQFIQLDPSSVSGAMYSNLSAPFAYFHGVAADPFRKLIYWFSSDPRTPIFSLRSYESIPPQGPTRIVPLYYTAYENTPTSYMFKNLTVYKGTFAKYQDLAFLVTEPRGPSHGANIAAVSTSSCPDGSTVCASTTQGNCGCFQAMYAAYSVADVSCSYYYSYTLRQHYPSVLCPFRR